MPSRDKATNKPQEELSNNLEIVIYQVEQLLKKLEESDKNHQSTALEMQRLTGQVESLTSLLRGSKSPSALNTRIAVLEERLSGYREALRSSNDVQVADKSGKWKLWAILATGAIGFFTSIATMLIQLLSK